MSERRMSRRAVAIGGGVAVAIGLTALGLEAPRLLERAYRKTPYDDLLGLLTDRDTAARLGRAARTPGFDAKTVAHDLREQLAHQSLGQVVDADIAKSRLAEVKGWVLPESLANLSTLAATAD
ncbi:MAG TPA: hypothetical protein VGU69_17310 [Rhizomicrobium sp.]|nr:hypothetical protein [Rhizomicrobium sp.]